MPKYYAYINPWASAISVGFANTGRVLSFTNQADRDKYVVDAEDMATKAITKREVTSHATYWGAVEPFSGAYWAFDPGLNPDSEFNSIAGFYGEIIICRDGTLEHFYA